MTNKNNAVLGAIAIAVWMLVGLPAWADGDAQAKVLIEVGAQFEELAGGTTNLLSSPKVTTEAGREATIKVVRDWPCPNGEIVENGLIFNVTPTIEGDALMLKGSAHIVEGVEPDKKKVEKTVEWVAFKEVKACFAVSVKGPDERFCLGPIRLDEKQIMVWLKARLVKY
jgi:hypothetical protein